MRDMKKTIDPVYREDFIKGYAVGFDPYSGFEERLYNEAFLEGFDSGRNEYEEMNGLIKAGIPNRIVNRKTLEDFLLAGMLGLEIDSDGYTTFQLDIIEVWYRNGIDQYDPQQTMYLWSILEKAGIEV